MRKSYIFYKDRISKLPEQYVNTIDSIMDIVATLDDVVKIILFGSCSRGTQNEKSDIDLLGCSKKSWEGIKRRKAT